MVFIIKDEYKDILLDVLRQHSEQARQKLLAVLSNLPKKAKTIKFGIFPTQDEDGTFDVVISLDGPDQYVLNKNISEYRTIFDVCHTEKGLCPEVPMFGFDETDFNVNDVIVDAAALWIQELWNDVAKDISPIPALIFDAEGYSPHLPIQLHNK